MRAGDVLAGRYRLVERIGRGGMATVFRGRDELLARDVAVKLLDPATAETGGRERFLAEARTLASLNHPRLVTLLDAGAAGTEEDDGLERHYLVMELVDGPDLARVAGGEALGHSAVARVGAQVAEGLAYVHAAGVVHRDVKPANILTGADGRVWLTDFGIARLADAQSRLTRTGTVLGSPAYLAPEQIAGEEITSAVDLYALGLVLLELLTGEPAFSGSPAEAAAARLVRDPVVPVELPLEWARLVHDLTAREPGRRPSAHEAARRLHELAGMTPEEPVAADALAATAAMTAVTDLDELAPTAGSRSATDGGTGGGTGGVAAPPLPPLPPLPERSEPSKREQTERRERPGGTGEHAVELPPLPPAPSVHSEAAAGSGRSRGPAGGGRSSRTVLLAAAAVLAVLLVVVVLALALGGDDGGGEPDVPEVPADVPAELQGPLQDLHDAVGGAS